MKNYRRLVWIDKDFLKLLSLVLKHKGGEVIDRFLSAIEPGSTVGNFTDLYFVPKGDGQLDDRHLYSEEHCLETGEFLFLSNNPHFSEMIHFFRETKVVDIKGLLADFAEQLAECILEIEEDRFNSILREDQIK